MTSNATDERSGAGRRQRLEARANAVREQLLEGLDALRGRKRLLLDPTEYARRHPAGAVMVAGAAALALAATAGVVGYRISTRRERLLRRRVDAWKRRLARLGPPGPAPRSVAMVALERSLLAAISGAVAALGRHCVEELLAHFRAGSVAPFAHP